jgi:hypothetical protein
VSRPLLLCRFGELFLKLGNRGRFERQLVDNIRAALAGLPGREVQAPHGRILVRVDESARDEACARLQRIFGLVSLSPAEEVAPDIDALDRRGGRLRPARARARPRPPPQLPHRGPPRGQALPVHVARDRHAPGRGVAAATGVPVNLEPAGAGGGGGGRHGRRLRVRRRRWPPRCGLPRGGLG